MFYFWILNILLWIEEEIEVNTDKLSVFSPHLFLILFVKVYDIYFLSCSVLVLYLNGITAYCQQCLPIIEFIVLIHRIFFKTTDF